MPPVAMTLVVAYAACLPLVVLTGVGAHARGWTPTAAVVAGFAFPLTWAVWYVADERSHRAQDR